MKNVSFLIVDDSQSVRSIVKSTVYDQLGSQRILSAVNGLTAKLILQKQPVDIIISDLEMPHLDGFELLSFVRSHPKLKDTPFIMMTSEDSKEFVVNAIEKGVSQYLVKPFTTEKLEDAIRRSWQAAEKRRNARVSDLPPHELLVQFNDSYSTTGALGNISASGALLELEYSEEILLFARCKISISMKIHEDRTERVRDLACSVVRIEAQKSADLSCRGCRVGVYIDEEANAAIALRSLNKLMDALTEEGLEEEVSDESGKLMMEEGEVI